ncbi:PadR family transcriptional regulator [Curtobacterium sp. MCSS17_015]|uniref:PadR family transcriptional regulator n=1 Tax=Curtobacterium sp. MCSS17_015 TaxID=2175666 RepID=UPI000DA7231B|nr:PadR family transcriptional regulator [Curtobacterium sp. MCSS17_015]WIB27054.1 PadR family transcriptional regulator [Curtobacterium sp. MCSS17_015]
MPDLTPLAYAALGLLNEGPAHPYEMFQTMVHRRDARNVKVRPGTLYHQVGRLVDLGLAEAVGTDRGGNRPERTTYAITDQGRTVLHDGLLHLLAEPADEYPVFHLAVAEIENISLAEAVAALTARAAALEGRRADTDEILGVVTAKDLPERYWLDVSYVRAMLTAQIEWLHATVERIQRGDVPWGGPDAGADAPADTTMNSNSKDTTR